MKVIMTMKSGNYNEEGKFLPWLMRISHNLIIDHFRKTNKVRFLSESRTLNEEFTIFHKLSTDEKNYLEERCETELESQMLGLLDHLPAMQREIIQMRISRICRLRKLPKWRMSALAMVKICPLHCNYHFSWS